MIPSAFLLRQLDQTYAFFFNRLAVFVCPDTCLMPVTKIISNPSLSTAEPAVRASIRDFSGFF